ncbi:unnamed protein product, partial [Discosporangium mesarthrocarpum]
QQHHFWEEAAQEGPVPPERGRRLLRELRTLSRGLPLHWGSSIAVRVDEDRPHLLKAMILAPGGTPYDSGAFLFDIYCPPQYPTYPPRFNLVTTGRGTVRFNPNLYECGKVCLSLLGTWWGELKEMNWSSDASLLQVLLAIQTLRVATLQWAMADVLRSPPRGFEELLQQHFWRKRLHLLRVGQAWVAEA